MANVSKWIQPGWFLAICIDCQPVTMQPFRSASDRDAWAAAHTVETSHDVGTADGGNRVIPWLPRRR